jgi:hypothetical protein
MRLYYTGASPDNLRKAREHAPSHVHGAGWTPQKMTDHDVPYFVDNGAYTSSFDADAYYETLDRALTEMPSSPDFFVLPDVYGDANATIDRHREWLYDRKLPVGSGEVMRYWVLQPGRPIEDQFDLLEGCKGVFVGGPQRWKRAYGSKIVAEAGKRDLRTHVGNPGGADGLLWAYRTGFDSVDTTTVFQNQYWHYLDRLERQTGPQSPSSETVQATLVPDGGRAESGGGTSHLQGAQVRADGNRCDLEYCQGCGRAFTTALEGFFVDSEDVGPDALGGTAEVFRLDVADRIDREWQGFKEEDIGAWCDNCSWELQRRRTRKPRRGVA